MDTRRWLLLAGIVAAVTGLALWAWVTGPVPAVRPGPVPAMASSPPLEMDEPEPVPASPVATEPEPALPEGPSIAGMVQDEWGTPVSGARIRAQGGPSATGDPKHNITVEAESGEDGSFRLADLKPGQYFVETTHRDYTPARHNQIPAGTEGMKIVLPGLCVVEGRVVNALTGEAIPEFEVEASAMPQAPARRSRRDEDKGIAGLSGLRSGMGLGGAMWASEPPRAGMSGKGTRFEDAQGWFRLERTQTGHVTVTARADGFLSGSAPAVLLKTGMTGKVEVRLNPERVVEGTVVDVRGAPVEGALIGVDRLPSVNGGPPDWRTGPEGAFRIGHLQELPEVVYAAKEGEGYGSAAVTNPGGLSAKVTIRLATGGTVEGVVMRRGQPVADADVQLAPPQDRFQPVGRGTTDRQGTYRITGVPPGEQTVWVQWREEPGSGQETSRRVQVEDGQVTVANFGVDGAGATLEGTVTEQGKATPCRVKALYGEHERQEVMNITADASGAFLLEDLPPGVLWIVFRSEATGKQIQRKATLGPGEVSRMDVDLAEYAQVKCWLTARGVPPERIGVLMIPGGMDRSQIASLRLVELMGMTAAELMPMQDGSHEASSVEPGTYTVVAGMEPEVMPDLQTATMEAFAFTSAVVEVQPGVENVVRLTLPGR